MTEKVEPKKSRKGGKRPGSGRKPGVPNKLTSTVKMMVLEALERAGGKGGGVAYLAKQAQEEPVAFMTLLGKVIPTQVVGDMSYRYVARIPAPEQDPNEWLKKYSPKTTHDAPATKQ